MISPPEHRHLVSLAIFDLAAIVLTVLSIVATVGFPLFGAPANYTGFFYVPPQAYLAGLLAPTSVVLAVATTADALRLSRRLRQDGWTILFAALLVLVALVPTYLIYSFGVGWGLPRLPGIVTPQYLKWEADAWWRLASAAAGVIVAQEVATLVFAWRTRLPLRVSAT